MDLLEIVGWIDIAAVCAVVFFLCFLRYYLTYFAIACKSVKELPKANKYTKFAVLIPARDESKVIANILKSLLQQDYPKEMFDVFVIVEKEDDPTIKIASDMGFKYVVRPTIGDRRTKGFALDDAYQYIVKNNLKFDAYMIFDADNIVSKDYLSKMNDVRNSGYQVGVGYRNFTNATKNWICSTSATLFSFMNQFTSRGRCYLFKKVTLTGTGYFLDHEIVESNGGWIWNGMTEDVELTNYCYHHNVKMYYYPLAMYFDEQPEDFKTLHKQHIRWVWGFFADKSRFKVGGKFYEPSSKINRKISLIEYNTSIYPFVVLSIVLLLAAIATFILGIVSIVYESGHSGYIFAHSLFQFSLVYIIFMFVAAFTLGIDNKNLKFSVKRCIIIVLTYFFFFGDFLFAFLDGLFHKEKRTNWQKVSHKGNIVDKNALEAEHDKKK